jgi:hypothetical protein
MKLPTTEFWLVLRQDRLLKAHASLVFSLVYQSPRRLMCLSCKAQASLSRRFHWDTAGAFGNHTMKCKTGKNHSFRAQPQVYEPQHTSAHSSS